MEKDDKTVEYKELETDNFKRFTHRNCEYFPCHDVANPEKFNCLFCYCPLYALGTKCGGKYSYTQGVKDCSSCLIPHSKGGYDYIMERFNEVAELAKEGRE